MATKQQRNRVSEIICQETTATKEISSYETEIIASKELATNLTRVKKAIGGLIEETSRENQALSIKIEGI